MQNFTLNYKKKQIKIKMKRNALRRRDRVPCTPLTYAIIQASNKTVKQRSNSSCFLSIYPTQNTNPKHTPSDLHQRFQLTNIYKLANSRNPIPCEGRFDRRTFSDSPNQPKRFLILRASLSSSSDPSKLSKKKKNSAKKKKKMYSNFKEQAIEYVKQAVEEDNKGNYARAFQLYMNALEYFKTHLKYEKNPKIKEAITQKFTEYLRRAEEIRAVLDDGPSGPPSSGDAAVATRPKTKPKDGDGEDPEQAKLRAGLNSAIVREKPDVKWNDVAGLESAKQALQEAVILPVKFPQFFTGEVLTFWFLIVRFRER